MLERIRSATADLGAAEKNKGSAFLLTSLTFIAGIFAALGVSNGTVSNMVRNHGCWAGAAIFLGAVAVLAGVWARTKKDEPKKQSYWIFAGLVLLLAAALCAVRASVLVTGDETAPRLTAFVEPSSRGDVINLGVQTAGLKHDERVDLAVWPVLSEGEASSLPSTGGTASASYEYATGGVPIYRSILGPSGDGDVNIEHTASLPTDHPPTVLVQAEVGEAKPNDCLDPDSRAGCVFLDLGDPGRPRLALRRKRGAQGPQGPLTLRISANDIAGQTVFLSVFANGIGKGHQVMRAEYAPDPAGNLHEKPMLRLPAGTHTVCAVVNTITTQSCPPLTTPSFPVLNQCITSIEGKPPLGDEKPTTREQAYHRCVASYPRTERRSTSWIRVRLP
jgi:hypothetical protein